MRFGRFRPRSLLLSTAFALVSCGTASTPTPIGSSSSADATADAPSGDTGSVDPLDGGVEGGAHVAPAPARTLDHPVFVGRPLDRAELFGDLERRCVGAGGAFVQDACACPVGSYFKTDLVLGDPEATAGASRCAPARKLSKAVPTFTSTLASGGVAGLATAFNQFGAAFTFGGDDATAADLAGAAAAWADGAQRNVAGALTNYGELPGFAAGEWAHFGVPPKEGERLALTVGKPDAASLRKAVGYVLNVLDHDMDGLNVLMTLPLYHRNRVAIVEPDPTMIGRMLGLPGFESSPPPFGDPANALPSGDAAVPVLSAAVAATALASNGGLAFTRAQVLMGESCMGSCRVTSEPTPLAEFADFSARRDRLYVYGAVAREVVWVERHDTPLAFVVLSRSGAAGLVGVLSDAISEVGVRRDVRAFDRLFHELGVVSYARAVDASGARNLPSVADAPDGGASPVARRALLTMCEADGKISALLDDARVARRLVRGPHPAVFDGATRELVSGSLLGWMGPHNGPSGVGDYLGWMLHDQYNGYAFLENGTPEELHPLEVATTAIAAAEVADAELLAMHVADAPPMRFTAVGVRTCLATKRYADAMAPYLSVINASYSEPFPYARCRDVEDLAAASTASQALWVFGAGNERRTDSTLNCPQKRMAGKGNVIIVAATNGRNYSNYGIDYADIAAAGLAEGTTLLGTSFSAPRVSGVATTLAAAFPTLTAEDLKMAILVGSSESIEVHDLVRTGGVLDVARSARLAQALSEIRRSTPEGTPLSRTDVTGAAVRVGISPERIQFLVGRGVLPEATGSFANTNKASR